MLLKRCLIIFAVVFCYSQVTAEITLKKTFFGGWKYSTDSVEYKSVGFSGTSLHDAMVGNEEAQTHMKKYQDAKTLSLVTGVPGGFLLGWPLGSYIGNGGVWKDSFTIMVAIGTPLAVVSIISESSATKNLKKAVSIYNDGGTTDEQTLSLMLDIKPVGANQTTTPFIGLRYGF